MHLHGIPDLVIGLACLIIAIFGKRFHWATIGSHKGDRPPFPTLIARIMFLAGGLLFLWSGIAILHR